MFIHHMIGMFYHPKEEWGAIHRERYSIPPRISSTNQHLSGDSCRLYVYRHNPGGVEYCWWRLREAHHH